MYRPDKPASAARARPTTFEYRPAFGRVALFELRTIVRVPLLSSSVSSHANGSSIRNGSSPDASCATAASCTAFYHCSRAVPHIAFRALRASLWRALRQPLVRRAQQLGARCRHEPGARFTLSRSDDCRQSSVAISGSAGETLALTPSAPRPAVRCAGRPRRRGGPPDSACRQQARRDEKDELRRLVPLGRRDLRHPLCGSVGASSAPLRLINDNGPRSAHKKTN